MVLEKVERNEGFEAARFFSSHLNYTALSELAIAFTKGENSNPDNDPNIMPTRFIILYGADDTKLQQIDDNPDCVDSEKHKNSVANLRKSLRAAGYEISENGAYDDELYIAHLDYQANEMQGISDDGVEEVEEEQIKPHTDSHYKATEKLTISLNVYPNDPKSKNDKATLYSNDMGRTYFMQKTIKDDSQQANNTLDIVFDGLDPNLNYTLEYEPGGAGKIECIFRNRPFGKWFD